jgi:hypothetical protein
MVWDTRPVMRGLFATAQDRPSSETTVRRTAPHEALVLSKGGIPMDSTMDLFVQAARRLRRSTIRERRRVPLGATWDTWRPE